MVSVKFDLTPQALYYLYILNKRMYHNGKEQDLP